MCSVCRSQARNPLSAKGQKFRLRNVWSRARLVLRLLLLYRLWVVKRSQGHTCGHFFVRLTALQSSRTKLEDGRGSVEGLGTWASDSSNVVLSRNPADGKE